MKLLKIFVLALSLLSLYSVSPVSAKQSTPEDVENLKNALIEGRIQVGRTRLKQVQEMYGEPQSITIGEKNIVYDYGDMKIEFDKARYMREWKYDSSRKPGYSTEINNLRRDLEGQKLPGDLISFDKIKKDYKQPTESKISEQDGERTIYYYGDIQLSFENFFVVKSWKGKKLEAKSITPKAETPTASKPAAPKADAMSGQDKKK